MKIKHLFTTAFILIGTHGFSQTELYGTWTAHCSYQQTSGKSVTTSSLCPVETTSDSSVTIASVKLTVDSTHIRVGDDNERISYIKRRSNNAITFVRDRVPYSFEIVLTTSDQYVILRGQNGQMLLLEKEEE